MASFFPLPSTFGPSLSFKLRLKTSQDSGRSRGHAFPLLASPKVSSGRGDSLSEIVMVDPLEAKQLAAKQMQQIKAKEKFKRRHQIEAINGAWAMIGLTAALVIEGQTGKGILDQLAGYWDYIVNFFVR